MTLEEKGPICPPPHLAPHLQTVSQTLQAWEGVLAATHWDLYDTTQVDGADFYVGSQELGHIHLNGEVHLATSPELRQLLVALSLAQPFPFGGDYAGWVLYRIRSIQDTRHALWLFQLNYLRLTGTPLVDLTQVINNYKPE